MKSSKEPQRVKGTDYVNSMRLILQLYGIICGTCAFISTCLSEAHGLSNQQAKKLVSLLALSLARFVKARSQKQNQLPP